MQISKTTMKSSTEAPQKLKMELPYDQQCHSHAYMQSNMSQVTTMAPAHPCLLQHYSQYLSYINSQDAPILMSGIKKM
jgi:chitinase